jgi:hypothetical protein
MRRPKIKLRSSGRMPPSAPIGLSVDERLTWAMQSIDEEMASVNGVFSISDRGPTLQMVLWRAGLSRSFLERKKKDSSRDELQLERKNRIKAWLGKPTNSPPITRVSTASTASDGLVEYELRQYIHEVELELVEANARIAELEARIEDRRNQP